MMIAEQRANCSQPDVGEANAPATGSICVITENRGFGGVEVHTIALIDTLLKRGYSIELVCCRHQLLDEAAKSPHWLDRVRMVYTDLSTGCDTDLHFRSNEWRQFFKGISSRKLLFPKINNSQGSIAFLRACRAHFSKVFFIEHLEEILPPLATRRIMGFIPAGLGLWWYRRRLFKAVQPRYADHTIAVSDAVKRGLTTLGAKTDRITTVHNGVAWRTLARDPATSVAFRKKYGIATDTFVFGMLVRLNHEKGVDIALRAVKHLATLTNRSFCLVIAGQGSSRDKLLSLASELGVESNVKFIGFAAAADVLSGYDSILFASRLEGLPLGLLEGMAAGCIPVVTRISGMPEAVSNSQLGWVVPPESPEELAEAMHSALQLDPRALATMRRAVTETVQARFDVDNSHRRIVQVLGL